MRLLRKSESVSNSLICGGRLFQQVKKVKIEPILASSSTLTCAKSQIISTKIFPLGHAIHM